MRTLRTMARNARDNIRNPEARSVYLQRYLWIDLLVLASIASVVCLAVG